MKYTNVFLEEIIWYLCVCMCVCVCVCVSMSGVSKLSEKGQIVNFFLAVGLMGCFSCLALPRGMKEAVASP